ncbi:MAG TPA: ROK family protein [Pseudogracilibacillus sp.]|nr:ROK family protein [Pseudogracilibacillus sp.]
MTCAIGLDIGGTKIAAAIVDQNGNLLNRTELPSDVTDKEAMFTQVVACIEKTMAKSTISWDEINGIGVGVPGKVDREAGIAIYQHNLPWGNFPLTQRLQNYFQIERVMVDNDVYMAAYSEWQQYGANQAETFVYITVSTGISCAIIHNGQFLRGSGFAGEVGLFPLIDVTGAYERLENRASGKAVRAKYGNKTVTTKDIFMKYHQQEAGYMEPVEQIVQSLAYSAYLVQCMLDPNTFVFGGGVMNHQPFLLEKIKTAMKQYVTKEQTHIFDQMFVSKAKGDTGIIGAGLVVFNKK